MRGAHRGEEAFLRPFWHWQCQHGTVLYTIYRNYRKLRCDNYGSTSYYNKYGAYHANRNRTIQLDKPECKRFGLIAKQAVQQFHLRNMPLGANMGLAKKT